MRQQYDKDPAVYDAAEHRLHRARSLPSKSPHQRIAQITNHLYLCSGKAVTKSALISLGITHVFNCTTDLPQLSLSGMKTTRISLEDRPRSNLGKYFTKVGERIAKESKRGGKTLIHCYAGVSRSATLCMAYLIKYYRLSLKNAFLYVRKQRPQVNPNNGFWEQLLEYERKLFGFNSVSLLRTRNGIIPDVYFIHSTQDTMNIQRYTAPPTGPRHCVSGRAFMVTLV